jgi:peptidoglycan/xylan/chitin deacetylase (PgdA/CDA1 family)
VLTRSDSLTWRYTRTVLGVAAAVAVLVVGGLTGHVRPANADDVNCAQVKCVALTFDDGPSPFTDRLLSVLRANNAEATFFLIGNKVAANPAGARRIADAGMEIGTHTWEHPNMTTIPPQDIAAQFSKGIDAIQAATGQRPTLSRTAGGLVNDAVLAEAGMEIASHTWEHPNMTAIPAEDIPAQFSKANDAILAATGQRPALVRTAGGLTNDQVLAEAGKQGLADINWDVIPFDWANDANIDASRQILMTQIKPGSVVLLHDTYSSTVDLVSQFIPVLKANGYHLVTVSRMLGPRAPGSLYGSRENGPPVNELVDIPADQIPPLPDTPSPAPMPNFPITDIPDQNSGGPTNGA